jgi:hypothetical protein
MEPTGFNRLLKNSTSAPDFGKIRRSWTEVEDEG